MLAGRLLASGERSCENLEPGPASQRGRFLGERDVLERNLFSWTLGQMSRLSNAVYCFKLEFGLVVMGLESSLNSGGTPCKARDSSDVTLFKTLKLM